MTTRQFLSILASCLLFAHPLSAGQWVGTGLVFGTLYAKTATGKGAHGKHKSTAAPRVGEGDLEKMAGGGTGDKQ